MSCPTRVRGDRVVQKEKSHRVNTDILLLANFQNPPGVGVLTNAGDIRLSYDPSLYFSIHEYATFNVRAMRGNELGKGRWNQWADRFHIDPLSLYSVQENP